MVNKYLKVAHIFERKFREILKYFCFDIDATTTSKLIWISRNSINKVFTGIRVRIAEICEENSILAVGFAVGEIELDESYFGAKRVKGKRGRGASGKTPVFGLLKRNGKVYI